MVYGCIELDDKMVRALANAKGKIDHAIHTELLHIIQPPSPQMLTKLQNIVIHWGLWQRSKIP